MKQCCSGYHSVEFHLAKLGLTLCASSSPARGVSEACGGENPFIMVQARIKAQHTFIAQSFNLP